MYNYLNKNTLPVNLEKDHWAIVKLEISFWQGPRVPNIGNSVYPKVLPLCTCRVDKDICRG